MCLAGNRIQSEMNINDFEKEFIVSHLYLVLLNCIDFFFSQILPNIGLFPLGSNSSGEVEDGYQGGSDLFPHACAAGNVGRLHKVGHVC